MTAPKLPELKDCPFCGGVAFAENYVIEAAVICFGCKARVVRRHGPKDDNGLPEAIAAWNTRAAVEASQPKAEEVEGVTFAEIERAQDRQYVATLAERLVAAQPESGGQGEAVAWACGNGALPRHVFNKETSARAAAEPGDWIRPLFYTHPQPSAVAWMSADGEFVSAAEKNRDKLDWYTTPLYTHPQPSAAVTEAVDCFESAFFEGWHEALAEGNIERIRDLWDRRISYAYAALSQGGKP